MLIKFFQAVRAAKVPASLKEFLDLMQALEKKIVFANIDEFYYLSRLCLVKDEKHFDKFDRAYGAYFEGMEALDDLFKEMIPEDWLKAEFEKNLTEEEKAQIEAMGGLEALMEAFKRGFGSDDLLIKMGRNFAFNFADNIAPLKKRLIREAAGIT